jgi:ssDNA-binding Zn-finger/Zn-ribbon topoisomerase 1
MYQPERFRINIPDTVPTYAFVGPCQSSVSYQYPYETTVSYQYPYETRVSYRYPYVSTVSYQYPYEIVVKRDDRNDVLLSDTTAIRRDVNQIKNDIGEIKRQQAPPTYYVVKEDYSNVECPVCNSSTSKKEQERYTKVPIYYCEKCQSFFEERASSVGPPVRTKTGITTYQDHYRRPPYSSSLGHLDRRITLNELQTEAPPSSAPAQHPRHWIPTASKNAYPHRRWNLSVPHPEP